MSSTASTPASTAPIRFGIFGAGAITRHSAQSVIDHPDAEIVGLHDPHAGRAETIRDKFSIPTLYPSPEALLADDKINAVYIGVPNASHAPLAIAALKAGKHVLLDKPMALNLTEARAIADAAKAAGTTFTVGMNMRFNADSQRIQALAAAGELGALYHAKAFWFRRQGIPRLGTWFGHKIESGGGCLLDIGVHLLDLAMWTVDRFDPVSVSGATYGKFGHRGLGEGGWGDSEPEGKPFDVEDFASAHIRFADGFTITLDVSWACHQADENRNDVHVFGDQAGASLFPARLFAAGDKGYTVTEKLDAPLAMPHCDRFHNFINAALKREPLCVEPSQALAVQSVLDAIYQSSTTGREVRLDG